MAKIELGIKLEEKKNYSHNDIKAMLGDAEVRINKTLKEEYISKESLTAESAKEILGEELFGNIEKNISFEKEKIVKEQEKRNNEIEEFGKKNRMSDEHIKYAKTEYGSIIDSEILIEKLTNFNKISNRATDGKSEIDTLDDKSPKVENLEQGGTRTTYNVGK